MQNIANIDRFLLSAMFIVDHQSSSKRALPFMMCWREKGTSPFVTETVVSFVFCFFVARTGKNKTEKISLPTRSWR